MSSSSQREKILSVVRVSSGNLLMMYDYFVYGYDHRQDLLCEQRLRGRARSRRAPLAHLGRQRRLHRPLASGIAT